MKYDIMRFDGSMVDGLAEAWVLEMEQRFEAVEVEDKFKVRLVAFVFGGFARKWWKSLEREGKVPTTWPEFRTVFYKQYFPKPVRNRKKTEFINLKQGTMTVREYEQKFNELSEFAPELVESEENKIDLFINGLETEIRIVVSSHPRTSFAFIFESAMEVEMAIMARPSAAAVRLPPPPQYPGSQRAREFVNIQPGQSIGQKRNRYFFQQSGGNRRIIEGSSIPGAPSQSVPQTTTHVSAPVSVPAISQVSIARPTQSVSQSVGRGRGRGRGQAGFRSSSMVRVLKLVRGFVDLM
ncbi:hypothetical protein Sjap_023529 [Stephania japonica]|uniref:Retrotransposon gag domain-containing protein n=1 Tax=Stephania japonica TaxID=461633 RepID=A0AAP0EEW1_9MAGN